MKWHTYSILHCSTHAYRDTVAPLAGNVEYFLRLRTTTDQPLEGDALVAAVGRAVAEGPQ